MFRLSNEEYYGIIVIDAKVSEDKVQEPRKIFMLLDFFDAI